MTLKRPLPTHSGIDSNNNNNNNNATTAPPTNDTTPPASTTATTATTGTTDAAVSHNSIKKRPYRRTKRPMGYNDKSSITTTTDALWQQPLNVYDAILAEAQDLHQAAMEAQQLGRYTIASTYLLLLHTRLVGLGKRFDKSIIATHPQHHPNPQAHHPTGIHGSKDQQDHLQHHHPNTNSIPVDTNAAATAVVGALHRYDDAADGKSGTQSSSNRATNASTTTTIGVVVAEPTTRVGGVVGTTVDTTTVSSFVPPVLVVAQPPSDVAPMATTTTTTTSLLQLPSNIEVDTAMMEHLARAAAELHAARSGKLLQQHQQQQHSPAHPHRHLDMSNSSNSSSHHHHHHVLSSPSKKSHRSTTTKLGILQSPDARTFLSTTANQQGVTNAATVTGVAKTIAVPTDGTVPSHTRTPPHSVVREQSLHTMITTTTATNTTTAMNHNHDNNNKNDHQLHTTDVHSTKLPLPLVSSPPPPSGTTTTPSNHGSSSRRPVTTAMNTVPYANCNARWLLRGAPTTDATTTATTITTTSHPSSYKNTPPPASFSTGSGEAVSSPSPPR
jgi:hypothetical protein